MEELSSTLWDILPQTISTPDLEGLPFWENYVDSSKGKITVHVAILQKLYLNLILNHQKTIESRFSKDRRRPYKKVKEGDIILLKASGGPISGIAYVDFTKFFELSDTPIKTIKSKYGKQMQIQDPAFWEECSRKSFATLIGLKHVTEIPPLQFIKRDRNAWISFSDV